MEVLQGYKTYIIAGIIVLGVIAEKILGLDVPGFDIADDQWLALVLGALGLGTLRSGVANVEKEVKQQTDLVEHVIDPIEAPPKVVEVPVVVEAPKEMQKLVEVASLTKMK